MTQASGPHDGRRFRRKRCDRCVERRIKCVGDVPCQNCRKTDHKCLVTMKKGMNAPIFVHKTQAAFAKAVDSYKEKTAVAIHSQPSTVRKDTYTGYFFVAFLHQNAFTGISTQFAKSLLSFIHYSPELFDAVNAIAALHISQSIGIESAKSDYTAALQAYSRSVRCVQAKIDFNLSLSDPSILWTTLLLGVFELMRDSTGDNWLAHFLHGTSAMLRLQGHSMLLKTEPEHEQHQKFFFTARVFELSRALVYTEPTFLSTMEWDMAIKAYWSMNPGLWNPKEALFDIVPQFVDMAIRTCDFIVDHSTLPQQEQKHCPKMLAEEGIALQCALLSWHSNFSAWVFGDTQLIGQCEESCIAQVYYHALSIYLDGIFSYHTPFTTPTAPECPILGHEEVKRHVEFILSISRLLLGYGCTGIMLFFPLRVAGARAHDPFTQAEVVRILDMITQRGFCVAQTFVSDLANLWSHR